MIEECQLCCREGKHSTHLAVPYRACGTPSQRSEFKHPDIAMCLTELAYMQRGLASLQVQDCLNEPFRQSLSQRKALYRCPASLRSAYQLAESFCYPFA